MSSPHLNNVLIIGCILAYVSGIISGLNNYDLSIICQVNKPLVNESVVKELSGILRIRKGVILPTTLDYVYDIYFYHSTSSFGTIFYACRLIFGHAQTYSIFFIV